MVNTLINLTKFAKIVILPARLAALTILHNAHLAIFTQTFLILMEQYVQVDAKLGFLQIIKQELVTNANLLA